MTSEELPDYERILEQNDAGQLLEYLEFRGRLAEGLELIKRNKNIWNTQVFKYFKSIKEVFLRKPSYISQ